MAETSSNEKRGRNLADRSRASIRRRPAIPASRQSRSIEAARQARPSAAILSAIASKRRVGFERVEENRLCGFEPLIIGFELRRRKRLFAFAGENGEREGPADAVDRRHEHADRRFAAEIRAQARNARSARGYRRRSTPRPAFASTLRRSPAARAPKPPEIGAAHWRRRSRVSQAASRKAPRSWVSTIRWGT